MLTGVYMTLALHRIRSKLRGATRLDPHYPSLAFTAQSVQDRQTASVLRSLALQLTWLCLNPPCPLKPKALNLQRWLLVMSKKYPVPGFVAEGCEVRSGHFSSLPCCWGVPSASARTCCYFFFPCVSVSLMLCMYTGASRRRIQTSETNSPSLFPYCNSYLIGQFVAVFILMNCEFMLGMPCPCTHTRTCINSQKR